MMTRDRTRARSDQFELRGWVYAFHEIRDQGRMAALVPETDETRLVTLYSGRTVEVRKGDVAIIFPQIGWPVPGASTSPEPQPEPEPQPSAVDRAAAVLAKFKAASLEPAQVISSVDELLIYAPLSSLLLPYRRLGETNAEMVSRLTPELSQEFDELTNDQLNGAGTRVLSNGKTVSQRHGELSALLDELARIGAAAEVARG